MDTWVKYFHVILNVLFIAIIYITVFEHSAKRLHHKTSYWNRWNNTYCCGAISVAVLAGLVLIAFGVYVLVGSPAHEMLTYVSGNSNLIYGMIAIGAVIFLVGACGALGSCYESKCLLLTYLTFNVIFFLGQVAFVVFVIAEKDNIQSHFGTVWYQLNNETKYLLQDRFSCCGYESQDEWSDLFPASCLNDTSTEDPRLPWTTTCYDSMLKYFEENIILAAVIVGALFFLEIFQMIVTCVMVRGLNNKQRYGGRDRMEYHNDESEGDDFDRYLKANG